MKNYQKILLSLIFMFISIPTLMLAQDTDAPETAFIWSANDEELEWADCPDFLPDDCRLAVLQGDPARPNADVFFKLQGNTKAPRHIHTSAERMVLISGEFHVDYEGQDPVVMNAGTYAYGPAGLPHTASCVSKEPCILFIAFEEPVDAIPVE
ncbi:MAG: cupin domain-containing protein [Balneolaceae bacterium]|nr:cupin domain-containing protein [Balneolaceae bacterium]MCH8549673.1 cupin domain-containing protein [Balneolaceae bacterium]